MSTPETPTAPTMTPSRTIYDVQADLDLDELLDTIVPPPSCEWVNTSTDQSVCGATPATWILKLSCGHARFYDDEHKARLETNLFGRRVECSDPSLPHHPPMMPATLAFIRIAS